MNPASHHELDQQIDRALHTIGHTASPRGLEDRVLLALDRHAAASPVVARPSLLRQLTDAPLRLLPIAGALALLAFLFLHPKMPVRSGATPHAHIAPPVLPQDLQGTLQTSAAPALAEMPSPRSNSVRRDPQTYSLHVVLTAPRPEPLQSQPPETPGDALEQQALADLRTPSYPAPPLPPTAQERLVRLMLRRGEKHELAQLNPEQEAAFARQERSAFGAFFDPPPDPHLRAEIDGSGATSPSSTQTQGASK